MKTSAEGLMSENEIIPNRSPLPGTYHVICVANGAKELAHKKDGKKDGTDMGMSIVETEVLAGTIPAQEGRKITLYLQFNDDGTPSEKHRRFLMAAGLLLPGQKIDTDEQGGFDAIVPGRQLLVAVDAYESKGKKGFGVTGFGLDMWHVDNPEKAAISKNKAALAMMKNKAALAMMKKTKAASGATSGGNDNQGTQAPVQSAVAADSDNDFSNV